MPGRWISRNVQQDYSCKPMEECNFAEQENAGLRISYVAIVSKRDALSGRGEGRPSEFAFR